MLRAHHLMRHAGALLAPACRSVSRTDMAAIAAAAEPLAARRTLPFAVAAAATNRRILHTRASLHSSSSADAATEAAAAAPLVAAPLAGSAPSAAAAVRDLPASFHALGLSSAYLRERLKKLGIRSPTEIQALVSHGAADASAHLSRCAVLRISHSLSPPCLHVALLLLQSVPDLCAGQSLILGAETGSGKSLAYVLPMLDWLLSEPVAMEQRKYPRVVVLQPNRELCGQLEKVLASLIGASGERDLPVTHPGSHADEASTKLYYGSLVGTQVFPPRGCSPVCDILITTPSAFEHQVPLVELARTRARAIKALKAQREQEQHDGQEGEEDGMEGAEHDGERPSKKRAAVDPTSLLTPSSSPNFRELGPRAFDPLAFIAAQRFIVLDEADMLFDSSAPASSSGGAGNVKKLLEHVWLRFEPPPGLAKLPDTVRRNRWARERKASRQPDWRDKQAEEAAEAEALALEEFHRLPRPFGRVRQYAFVGATLENVSPLSTFQYLLNTFTPRDERPPPFESGPRSTRDEDLPPGCHLKLRLSSGLHRLSPALSKPGTIQWTRVGPAHRQTGAGKAWDPETGIDLDRLDQVDRAARMSQGSGGRSEVQQIEDETRELAEQLAMSGEERALRARGNRRAMGAGGKSFPSKADIVEARAGGAEGSAAATSSSKRNKVLNAPPFFTDPTDIEKVHETARFLNAHTSAPTDLASSSSALPPPAKSLLFVSTPPRVATLVSHLRSLQSTSLTPSEDDLASGRALSLHVQLLPYHAEMRHERAQVMSVFNSQTPAVTQTLTPTPAQGKGASSQTTPSRQQGATVPVTHQVLLCTSLAARGLDFEEAAPLAAASARRIASLGKAGESSAQGVLPASDQAAGFASLVQFDLATNVVDYIHRCGRMFRHRPAPISGEDAATQAAHTADSAVSTSEPASYLPQLLHLYTAEDELLVSHLRANEGSTDGQAADAHSTCDPSTDHTGTSIPDSAFSRNRRMRHKAKKAERAAREEDQLRRLEAPMHAAEGQGEVDEDEAHVEAAAAEATRAH